MAPPIPLQPVVKPLRSVTFVQGAEAASTHVAVEPVPVTTLVSSTEGEEPPVEHLQVLLMSNVKPVLHAQPPEPLASKYLFSLHVHALLLLSISHPVPTALQLLASTYFS